MNRVYYCVEGETDRGRQRGGGRGSKARGQRQENKKHQKLQQSTCIDISTIGMKVC